MVVGLKVKLAQLVKQIASHKVGPQPLVERTVAHQNLATMQLLPNRTESLALGATNGINTLRFCETIL
jgi:hypothetical protein